MKQAPNSIKFKRVGGPGECSLDGVMKCTQDQMNAVMDILLGKAPGTAAQASPAKPDLAGLTDDQRRLKGIHRYVCDLRESRGIPGMQHDPVGAWIRFDEAIKILAAITKETDHG